MSGLGATLNAAGEVEIAIARCPDELVYAIEIGHRPGGPSGECEDVWSVASGEGRALDSFVVGVTPAGFAVEIDNIPENLPVAAVEVHTNTATRSGSYDVEELVQGVYVMAGRTYTSLEELENDVEDQCRPRS